MNVDKISQKAIDLKKTSIHLKRLPQITILCTETMDTKKITYFLNGKVVIDF